MIYIDFRERALIEECQKIVTEYKDIQIESKNLHLGDIMIDKIILERKTWPDLEASLKDKRYTEQSFRLQEAMKEGFRIYYCIEGDLSQHHGSIPKETLRKVLFGLMEKGFFVLQTKDCKDTARYLMQLMEKKPQETVTYEESCITKQKNKHITRDNISLFMLCQIPSISMKTAQILMHKYGHISELFRIFHENPNEFHEFSYEKDGKSKKLNKNIIQNLQDYLSKS